jgi:Tissue inhibitor of metalloproteinase
MTINSNRCRCRYGPTMFASSLLLLLCLWLTLPANTGACSCTEPRSVQGSLNLVDSVFRGWVVRKLRDVTYESNYVVRVNSIYKGCDFAVGDRIIVTTGKTSSLCGVSLPINGTFVLAGFAAEMDSGISQQLPKKTKISQVVNVGLCDYNVDATTNVPSTDLKVLRSYDNTQCVP